MYTTKLQYGTLLPEHRAIPRNIQTDDTRNA